MALAVGCEDFQHFQTLVSLFSCLIFNITCRHLLVRHPTCPDNAVLVMTKSISIVKIRRFAWRHTFYVLNIYANKTSVNDKAVCILNFADKTQRISLEIPQSVPNIERDSMLVIFFVPIYISLQVVISKTDSGVESIGKIVTPLYSQHRNNRRPDFPTIYARTSAQQNWTMNEICNHSPTLTKNNSQES